MVVDGISSKLGALDGVVDAAKMCRYCMLQYGPSVIQNKVYAILHATSTNGTDRPRTTGFCTHPSAHVAPESVRRSQSVKGEERPPD